MVGGKGCLRLCLQWCGHLYVTPCDWLSVCGVGGSLVMLPVQRPSLCTSSTGVNFVCV